MKPRTAVVLAAGMGRRLGFLYPPKPIVMLSKPLLYYSLSSLASIGIKRVYVVTNPWSRKLIEDVLKKVDLFSLTETEVLWRYWEENGSSLLTGLKRAFTLESEGVILVMSDHVFEPLIPLKSFEELEECPIAVGGDRSPRWVDVNEATKIRSFGDSYAKIFSKKLREFDFIDTGVFAFRRDSLEMIEEAYKNGALSVSEIMNYLAQRIRICIADVTGSSWIDVDTFSELMFDVPKVNEELNKKLFIKLFQRVA